MDFERATMNAVEARFTRSRLIGFTWDNLGGDSSSLDLMTIIAKNLQQRQRRNFTSVCWDFICRRLLFLASTVFALSCQCICNFVVLLFAFSRVINVQQFRHFCASVTCPPSPVPDMTYVFGGTLSLTQSINQSIRSLSDRLFYSVQWTRRTENFAARLMTVVVYSVRYMYCENLGAASGNDTGTCK